MVTPTAAVSVGAAGMVPWALAVLGVVSGLLIYVCHSVVVGILGWKAPDKTTPERVADVMDAVAERPQERAT